MKKKIWIIIGFFVVLIAVFYAIIGDQLTDSSVKLGVINPEVPAFSFTDQNGNEISQRNTDGKVYVTEYFFTTCEGICPIMNANMRRVFDKYKNEPDFLIVSHTCQPEVDSVPILKAYERKMVLGNLHQKSDGEYVVTAAADSLTPVVNPNWFFVTGDKAALYKMARQGYIIDDGKPDTTQIQDQFIHTQFFALVDKNRKVRGIYDGLKNKEVNQMMEDIHALLNEKTGTKRFLGSF